MLHRRGHSLRGMACSSLGTMHGTLTTTNNNTDGLSTTGRTQSHRVNYYRPSCRWSGWKAYKTPRSSLYKQWGRLAVEWSWWAGVIYMNKECIYLSLIHAPFLVNKGCWQNRTIHTEHHCCQLPAATRSWWCDINEGPQIAAPTNHDVVSLYIYTGHGGRGW